MDFPLHQKAAFMRISDRHLALVVWGLGITQIVGYGTLYYSFSILAPEMARDFSWSLEWVYGALSAALLAGGLVAPLTGRWIDRQGAAHIMTIGSIAAALSLAACALAPERIAFFVALLALQVASGLVQYNAAFALLVQIAPNRAQRSITHLTLIAGFASTLFWPLTTLLHEHLTWRSVYLAFAVVNILVSLPIHWRLSSLTRQKPTAAAKPLATEAAVEQADVPMPPEIPVRVIGSLPASQRPKAFLLMAAGFTLMSFVLSALLVHMVPMLGAIGLGALAVLVGTVFGPAQVLARFVNMIFGAAMPPARLAIVSATALPLAITILLLTAPWLGGAVVFALLFGAGSGLNSIVQGTLPLTLFGSDGYGALVGRITGIRLVVAAAAPFIFAFVSEQFGVYTALIATGLVGAASVFAFVAVTRLAGSPAASS
jgi:MFS family permease